MAASMLVAQASGLPDAMQARTLHHSMNMINVDCGRSPDRATKRIGDLIDDHDMPSKRLFTFLMFIFTLVETSGKEGAPIVTIPAQ
jgi:hypothetical protein